MASALIRGAMEVLLLALLCLAPWGYGGVEPVVEAYLDLGLTVLLGLWGVRMLVEGRLTWVKCPVLLCLACLFWFGVWQVVPLPRDLLNRLSPATVRLTDSLLPAQPEQLPVAVPARPPLLAAGATLSVYPGKTRQELFRLLAVLLTFALVRNNIASPASLERLFLALVLNGSLLAFFAIVQLFSSPAGMIYWSVQTPGTVFGPFISRTHFPFYVNICIGAGLGLLMARRQSRSERPEIVPIGTVRSLMEDSAQLWLVCALALMITSVLFSLSRGGFLTLLAGVLPLLLLGPLRGRRLGWVVPAGVMVLLAVGLLGWLGLGRVEQRLTTLATGKALESRIPLWRDSSRLVPDFPIWGTGWGTFAFVEPLERTHAPHDLVNEYAHNELLEALVEGGVIRLGLTLVLIGTIFVLGVRAVLRHTGQPAGGLALGALFAFTTLVVQSIGDFGIHLPAIALVATVLSAQIVSLGLTSLHSRSTPDDAAMSYKSRGQVPRSSTHSRRSEGSPGRRRRSGGSPAPREYVLRLGGLAPLAAAVLLLVLGGLLSLEGWRTYQAETLRDEARAIRHNPDPQAIEARVADLETAVRLAPDHARLRNDLAQAHLDAYEMRLRGLRDSWAFASIAQQVLALTRARPDGGFAGLEMVCSLRTVGVVDGPALFASDTEAATRDHLYPALREFVLARNTCPLLAQAQIALASNQPQFRKADPRRAYLDRAKRLVTNDPSLYFLFGLEDYLDGHVEQALASWRRSLELADTHLPAILALTRKGPRTSAFYEQLLPDDPGVLLAAGLLLKKEGQPSMQVRALWEKALTLAGERHSPPEGADYELQARILLQLDRKDEAIAAYQEAIRLEPRRAEWHYELAGVLLERRKYQQARDELRMTLILQPDHTAAQRLQKKVIEEQSKTGTGPQGGRKASWRAGGGASRPDPGR